MKQCPQCRTTYTDDSLSFCLADGTSLTSLPDDESTLVISKGDGQRFKSAGDEIHVQRQAGPSTAKAVIIIGLVALFMIAGIGLGAALLYFNRQSRKADVVLPATPSPMPSPTADLERQKLQDQLANMQRQLDEQKAANNNDSPSVSDSPSPVESSSGFVTARVNSPNDGFLALRDKPHAQLGDRLEKIPHGATVTIENCGPLQRRLGGRLGRWCMVIYNGKTGYVFDAFLDRQ